MKKAMAFVLTGTVLLSGAFASTAFAAESTDNAGRRRFSAECREINPERRAALRERFEQHGIDPDSISEERFGRRGHWFINQELSEEEIAAIIDQRRQAHQENCGTGIPLRIERFGEMDLDEERIAQILERLEQHPDLPTELLTYLESYLNSEIDREELVAILQQFRQNR